MTTEPPAAFRVADARRDGMTRRQVDRAELERPFTGLRAARADTGPADPDAHPADVRREALIRAARQFAAHMHEGEFFSHATAAALWGLPLPALDLTELDVAVCAPSRAPRGRGVRGHQLAGAQVTAGSGAHGLRMTSPASTWAQLGRVVRHPYDLTAVADAVILVPRIAGPFGRVLRPPLADVADLERELRRGRRIGIAALEEALLRTRHGSVSRPETWCRLTIVDAGLPEPVLDHDVYDDAGQFVGCVDLAYPGLRIAIEYEGDHHRVDLRQWNRDIAKHDRLAELGWRVIRVTRSMVFDEPGVLIGRVRSALRARA
ncbi:MULTISPECIES: hypothetical protein [unclassified Microbacterium]|uniref:endonuclease domain-containing protein n=1 Tax=unclassified Microbacterium TaxID=2609290 RepID=UPI00214CA171|nr:MULTISPECIES: hypothetical protein [unclassified Microbacterium]MCR2810141.1 hypothetical protein [Microbacterium sp. zg.B185]WIM20023.1 hypothetical protein QNO12_04240 [Microbacterium sp. zg-B185]